jgi:hypothetical protein
MQKHNFYKLWITNFNPIKSIQYIPHNMKMNAQKRAFVKLKYYSMNY